MIIEAKPPNHIILSVVVLFFFCWIFGLIALIMGMQVHTYMYVYIHECTCIDVLHCMVHIGVVQCTYNVIFSPLVSNLFANLADRNSIHVHVCTHTCTFTCQGRRNHGCAGCWHTPIASLVPGSQLGSAWRYARWPGAPLWKIIFLRHCMWKLVESIYVQEIGTQTSSLKSTCTPC